MVVRNLLFRGWVKVVDGELKFQAGIGVGWDAFPAAIFCEGLRGDEVAPGKRAGGSDLLFDIFEAFHPLFPGRGEIITVIEDFEHFLVIFIADVEQGADFGEFVHDGPFQVRQGRDCPVSEFFDTARGLPRRGVVFNQAAD